MLEDGLINPPVDSWSGLHPLGKRGNGLASHEQCAIRTVVGVEAPLCQGFERGPGLQPACQPGAFPGRGLAEVGW